jgi:hypothetical protein
MRSWQALPRRCVLVDSPANVAQVNMPREQPFGATRRICPRVVALFEPIVHRTQRLELQLLDRVVAFGKHIADLMHTHIDDAA